MTLLEGALVLLAGVWAGGINAVVGSGTLITFPTLLALGVPPVTANISNGIGLVPGSVAGVLGYRRELQGQRARVGRLLVASALGGVAGAVLLLVLPPGAFEAIVPVLILLAVVLVVVQPWLSRRMASRSAARSGEISPELAAHREHHGTWWVWPSVLGAGAYGGYFGAAQGVLLMGILGIGIDESLQRLNAVKNVLSAVVNALAGAVFVLVAELGLFGSEADVDWLIVALIGAGSIAGGFLGAAIGRRLPPLALRAVIVVVGLTAFAVLVLG